MRKGNVKILLLMLFILAGLAFVFLLTLKSNSQADKVTQAVSEDAVQLAQTQETERTEQERQAYSKDLNEFKKRVSKLDQRDMTKFKTQTRDSFMELADLIDDVQGEEAVTGAAAPTEEAEEKGVVQEGKEEIQEKIGLGEEETEEIRKNAKKITAVEDENELVSELKSGFNASKEAVKEVAEEGEEKGILGLGEDQAAEKKESKFDEKMDEIGQKINELDQQNYKAKSKEIFTDFYEALNYLNEEETTT